MADQKISQLSDGGTSQATDEYVIARSGANYRIDGASIAAAATSVGTLSSLTVSGDVTVDTSTLKVDSANNRVGIGTSSPGYLLDVRGSSPDIVAFHNGANGSRVGITATNTAAYIGTTYSTNDIPLIFTRAGIGSSGSELMRLDTSGNLGIGTASPSETLHVVGNALATGSAGSYPRFISTVGAKSWELGYRSGTSQFEIREDGTTRVEITNGGNLGLGVTPSAWGGGGKAFEVGALGNGLQGRNTQFMTLTQNAYYNALAQYIYGSNGLASRYDQDAGAHKWYNAASGTAGNVITFTQAMTLAASGNLLLGLTSDAAGFRFSTNAGASSNGHLIAGSGTGIYSNWSDGTSTDSPQVGGIGNALVFRTSSTERARIPAAGGMVVGTAAIATTATDGFLYVPTCAGTPTGTPTTQTGTAPIVVDTTNNKLYFYSGGSWRDAGP